MEEGRDKDEVERPKDDRWGGITKEDGISDVESKMPGKEETNREISHKWRVKEAR